MKAKINKKVHIRVPILIVFWLSSSSKQNQFNYWGVWYLHYINCRIFSQKANCSCR